MAKYKVTRTTVTSHIIEYDRDSFIEGDALDEIKRYPYNGEEIEDREIWSVEKLEG